MYIKLETTRLDYYRQNQSNLRSELYQGIMDSVLKGETRGSEIGKRIVLPASFIGGPRDMRRRYLDALALVQRFGKPNLFITMTCNPEWNEIQEKLFHGQRAQDRPDLTSRVFRAKLQDLKDQLFKKEIFGQIAAHVHVIEFQKRGLPHAHMLIILKFEHKLTICSGVTAVKYLYKYIYKGHDRVTINISQTDEESCTDEIKQFQDARWVSAQEAMWRIFEFNLNEIYPAVVDLQLHLPNQQCVTYWANQDLENVLRWEHASKTMLTEYFSICAQSEKARQLLYREFPEYYVWDKKSKIWKERKQRNIIGRIHTASPIEGERYYLRILLNRVRGPTSFEDLLIVNGVRCSSFKEAAQRRGLLESDQSIIDCLNEAMSFQMPQELRLLFAIILVYCAPTDVRKLWETYFEALSEDFKKDLECSQDVRVVKTLTSLNFFLESMGKGISSYDLPAQPTHTGNLNNNLPREIQEELAIKTPPEDYEAELKLNPKQKIAFTQILDCIRRENGGLFFIDGPGGTGKTFLYRALLAHLRSKGFIAIATATSGVAAAILPGGRTAHSRFKIPIDANELSECTMSKQSGATELLRRAELIIWDETPMAKRWAIENVDRLLQDIVGKTMDFGGKVMVFGGDFRQVFPVVPRATIYQTIAASLVKSDLWPKMKRITLSWNMRARNDPSFSEFLLRVGNGEEPTDTGGNIKIPEEMVVDFDNEVDSIQRLINVTFLELQKNIDPAYISSRAILAAKNEDVDMINEKLISVFPGKPRIFISFDEAIDDSNNYYEQEFLNSLTPNGLPPHKLVLKRNSPIILLRNLDPSNGLCNGTRMICREFGNNLIDAKIIFGQHSGKHVLIPRIPLSPADNEGYPFHFKRKQFPIRLCFAITINKVQGQTIQNIGVYLPHSVFSHGQLYVALSRGTSMSTTKVLIKPNVAYGSGKLWTKYVVYKQVFSEGCFSSEQDNINMRVPSLKQLTGSVSATKSLLAFKERFEAEQRCHGLIVIDFVDLFVQDHGLPYR